LKAVKFIISIVVPLAIGGISGIATAGEINGWYSSLNKPSFNPPNWLFGPVWTSLYLFMGISLFMVWKETSSRQRNSALLIFCIQLLLNFLWSFLFFYFKNIGIALIEIFLLWILIILMIRSFYIVNKIAALMNTPYLLWVTFASILNLAYFILN
jgi:benzodiazapine receptor